MTPAVPNVVAATTGVATMAVGGLVAGGWWWSAAVVGAGASVAGTAGRRAGLLQAVATLVLTAGVVAAGQEWAAALLAVGVLVSLEVAAGADRASRVRPAGVRPAPGRLLVTLVPAPVVLVAADLAPRPAVPLTLLAVLAGATLLSLSIAA